MMHLDCRSINLQELFLNNLFLCYNLDEMNDYSSEKCFQSFLSVYSSCLPGKKVSFLFMAEVS